MMGESGGDRCCNIMENILCTEAVTDGLPESHIILHSDETHRRSVNKVDTNQTQNDSIILHSPPVFNIYQPPQCINNNYILCSDATKKIQCWWVFFWFNWSENIRFKFNPLRLTFQSTFWKWLPGVESQNGSKRKAQVKHAPQNSTAGHRLRSNNPFEFGFLSTFDLAAIKILKVFLNTIKCSQVQDSYELLKFTVQNPEICCSYHQSWSCLIHY